jgi:DNA-directed RNA polymerase specialized sigma24 family protein
MSAESTTPGYEAEPTEVEALTADLADHADDPSAMFARASAMEALYRAAANRAADYRARACARMSMDGLSYAQIAKLTGLTRSRVQQLVERGRDVPIGHQPKTASRAVTA